VLITRKLGTSGNPELAMGRWLRLGPAILNTDIIEQFSASEAELGKRCGANMRRSTAGFNDIGKVTHCPSWQIVPSSS
jgi:hypothetical protein